MQTKFDIEKCLFCGNEDETKFYVGHHDSLSVEIRCQCGAGIIEEMSHKYELDSLNELEKIEKELKLDTFQAMAFFHIRSVITKWNRRV